MSAQAMDVLLADGTRANTRLIFRPRDRARVERNFRKLYPRKPYQVIPICDNDALYFYESNDERRTRAQQTEQPAQVAP